MGSSTSTDEKKTVDTSGIVNSNVVIKEESFSKTLECILLVNTIIAVVQIIDLYISYISNTKNNGRRNTGVKQQQQQYHEWFYRTE